MALATSTVRLFTEQRVALEQDVFYYPNFVTVSDGPNPTPRFTLTFLANVRQAEEEEYLVRKINDSPQLLWKKLPSRRLQIWGGEITAKGNLIAQPLPPIISKYPDIISRIKATGAFESAPHQTANHVILNEYLPGQGIMPHEDGPRYHPVVATLSLGSHAVFHYYQYWPEAETAASNEHGKAIDTTPVLSILLEPRSLIISSGGMYTSHLHGIDGVEEDLIASPQNSAGIVVANLDQVENPLIKQCIGSGAPLKRGVRYSLTCRDVGRVSHLASHR